MKKPIIGLVPLFDDEKESLWMLPGYMDGITEADIQGVCETLSGALIWQK
ncbi:hypothetical protein [Butyrivibrio sp. XPD2006]|nr:hypothetical protein [Butyrivibrio sp. XPD2006]